MVLFAGVRELETKIHFEDSDTHRILESLRISGYRLTMPVSQLDRVFAFDRDAIERPGTGAVVARVRVQDDRAFLTVKVRRSADLDRTEHETEVADGTVAHQILSALGLTEFVRVAKKRWTASLGDGVTVCVDEVAGLGTFVEIEVLGREGAAPDADLRDRVRQVVAAVGGPHRVVGLSYDRMLLAAAAGDAAPV
jgi:predicted adenylyl cyclase CyaB